MTTELAARILRILQAAIGDIAREVEKQADPVEDRRAVNAEIETACRDAVAKEREDLLANIEWCRKNGLYKTAQGCVANIKAMIRLRNHSAPTVHVTRDAEADLIEEHQRAQEAEQASTAADEAAHGETWQDGYNQGRREGLSVVLSDFESACEGAREAGIAIGRAESAALIQDAYTDGYTQARSEVNAEIENACAGAREANEAVGYTKGEKDGWDRGYAQARRDLESITEQACDAERRQAILKEREVIAGTVEKMASSILLQIQALPEP